MRLPSEYRNPARTPRVRRSLSGFLSVGNPGDHRPGRRYPRELGFHMGARVFFCGYLAGTPAVFSHTHPQILWKGSTDDRA